MFSWSERSFRLIPNPSWLKQAGEYVRNRAPVSTRIEEERFPTNGSTCWSNGQLSETKASEIVRTAGFLRWEGECIFTSGHSGSSVGGSHQFGIQRISWSSQDRKALFPRIRPINLPHGWLLDHLIPRCFSTECKAMPAATLTFKEPILPAIGMLPRRSAWPSKAGEIPVSSAPNIRSSGPLRSIASN